MAAVGNPQPEPIILQNLMPVARSMSVTDIVLIILGILSLGVAASGLSKFGSDEHWWTAQGLNNLSHISAISMMSVGGICSLLFFILAGLEQKKPSLIPPLTGSVIVDPDYENDILHCNPDLGFACMFDNMEDAGLRSSFESFLPKYGNKLRKLSSKEVSSFVSSRETMDAFELTSSHVAVIQLVKDEQGSLTLFTIQTGKTAVYIEMEDGRILHPKTESASLSPQEEIIKGAKRILGFSSGITAYVKQFFLESFILSSSTDRELYDKIMTHIKSRYTESSTKNSTMNPEKFHHKSLFVLNIVKQ